MSEDYFDKNKLLEAFIGEVKSTGANGKFSLFIVDKGEVKIAGSFSLKNYVGKLSILGNEIQFSRDGRELVLSVVDGEIGRLRALTWNLITVPIFPLRLAIGDCEYKVYAPLFGGLDPKRRKPKYGKIIDKSGNKISILVGPGRKPKPEDSFELRDLSNSNSPKFLDGWTAYPKLLSGNGVDRHRENILTFAAIALYLTNTYVKVYP